MSRITDATHAQHTISWPHKACLHDLMEVYPDATIRVTGLVDYCENRCSTCNATSNWRVSTSGSLLDEPSAISKGFHHEVHSIHPTSHDSLHKNYLLWIVVTHCLCLKKIRIPIFSPTPYVDTIFSPIFSMYPSITTNIKYAQNHTTFPWDK